MQPAATGRARAFTLVELLVVVAIIAIVAGMVAPYASGSLAGMRVRQAALTLAEHIRYAQALAVDRERATRLSIDEKTPGYRLELAKDLVGVEFAAAPGVAGAFISLPERVRFDGVAFAFAPDGVENALLFFPQGQWSSGRLWLTDGTDTFLVRINNGLGRVDVLRLAPGERIPREKDYGRLLEKPL